MSITAIEINGKAFLVDFTFHPRTLFEGWSIDINAVMSEGHEIPTSDEWDKQAADAILATHGTSLQDAAEEAQFEKQTGAYE